MFYPSSLQDDSRLCDRRITNVFSTSKRKVGGQVLRCKQDQGKTIWAKRLRNQQPLVFRIHKKCLQLIETTQLMKRVTARAVLRSFARCSQKGSVHPLRCFYQLGLIIFPLAGNNFFSLL
jgi:hypothetical protein